MVFTKKEAAVIVYVYEEGFDDYCTLLSDIRNALDLSPKSLDGVLGSLFKKGIISVGPSDISNQIEINLIHSSSKNDWCWSFGCDYPDTSEPFLYFKGIYDQAISVKMS